jgi:hypothetical protein
MGSSGSNQHDHVADEFGSLDDFVETVACLRGGFDARINLLRAAMSLGLDVLNHFFSGGLAGAFGELLGVLEAIAISSPVRSP